MIDDPRCVVRAAIVDNENLEGVEVHCERGLGLSDRLRDHFGLIEGGYDQTQSICSRAGIHAEGRVKQKKD
jgi:hypothetical protein